MFRRQRRVRDSASFGAASLGVLLLVGAALGTGVARTAVDVEDGLTWLPDNPRGEVVQVNPASGRPEVRLQVSGGDAQLDITQKDGLLVILDRRNGQITSLDLATLLASGRRQAPPGPTTKVLVSDGRIYVVDRTAGTVANADPVTLADVGKAWRAGKPLADVVADDDGVVWAVDQDGRLHALEWSGDRKEFRRKSSESIRGAGPATVLVPHTKGVTLFGLDGGVVRQVGTGQDVSGSLQKVPGEVLAAKSSPPGLVPAAVPSQGTVVIVAGDRVVRVDVAALGCQEPARPVVFHDKVYVPCMGAGKVIVLDKSGKRGGKDVSTPGDGDPELVFDDGRLFISTPGAERGVIVDADGSTHAVTIRSPELQVVDPDRPPIPEVPTPPRPSPRPETPDNRGDNRNDPRPPDEPGPGVPGSSSTGSGEPGAGQLPDAPTGVTVTLVSRTASDVVVSVSWTAADDNGEKVTGYTVEGTGGFTGGKVDTQTTSTSTQLTISCAGTTFCTGGQLAVEVTALNPVGESAPGTHSFTVPAEPTTQNPPPANTPPPTENSTPPQPPPNTPPPAEPPPNTPPPATVPAAGATVITGVTSPNGAKNNTRRLTTSPPADWAGHDGSCELYNTSLSSGQAISCTATTVDVYVETDDSYVYVVRARARDGSRFVDSASKLVRGPVAPPEMCGKVYCVGGGKIVELTPTSKSVDFGQAGAGLGLLVMAVLLRFVGRRPKDEEETP
ncbi:fibronectin type III domain-containing protein [Actinophytocola sp.]|uniref:fibronectin type III domain-containing protein n=1 Tax=Actinophytocola sp. TaxID=1872138 RepID=UPI002ED0E842